MKLKYDDILMAGDVIHYASGEILVVDGLAGTSVSVFLSTRDHSSIKKITRKAPRVSRKEYKRRALEAEKRIETALEYVKVILDGDSRWLDTDESLCVVKILRGEE